MRYEHIDMLMSLSGCQDTWLKIPILYLWIHDTSINLLSTTKCPL